MNFKEKLDETFKQLAPDVEKPNRVAALTVALVVKGIITIEESEQIVEWYNEKIQGR